MRIDTRRAAELGPVMYFIDTAGASPNQAQRAAATSWCQRRARFITGTDLLIDGGVIASIRAGEYQLG